MALPHIFRKSAYICRLYFVAYVLPPTSTESTTSISGPQGSWRGSFRLRGGRQEERRPPAGGGHREERRYRDYFGAGRASDQRMEYEDSIPMERRPTLPVMEILAAERQERSWESAPIPGRWGHPSVADRSRGISDLGMAGQNIGTPALLQRGGRSLLPAGASTPLGGGSGELPRTYSGSSARVDYRRRLELNTKIAMRMFCSDRK
jgi:hypothetical protein